MHTTLLTAASQSCQDASGILKALYEQRVAAVAYCFYYEESCNALARDLPKERQTSELTFRHVHGNHVVYSGQLGRTTSSTMCEVQTTNVFCLTIVHCMKHHQIGTLFCSITTEGYATRFSSPVFEI